MRYVVINAERHGEDMATIEPPASEAPLPSPHAGDEIALDRGLFEVLWVRHHWQGAPQPYAEVFVRRSRK